LNDFSIISIEKNPSGGLTSYSLDLTGIYQMKNVVTTLQAVDVLQKEGFVITDSHVQAALQNVKGLTGFYGRWEVIHQNPLIILEVAHNLDGIRQMLSHINQLVFNKLHIVFGMVNDKDTNKIISMLPAQAVYYFTKAQIPRALVEDELLIKAKAFNLQGEKYAYVNDALYAAVNNADKDDLIIVCGSVFVVAEVDRTILNQSS
ncbi:MAG TPA: cyanophycin synthetase, partial [Chitinophagaceae bacterium]|nr:cyanophycin synthetase [Chitinophagaceae bacterium]